MNESPATGAYDPTRRDRVFLVLAGIFVTHALLGDTDEALSFLGRELSPRRHSPGSLARQKEWAAADPDLESLRDDPRFQALVAP